MPMVAGAIFAVLAAGVLVPKIGYVHPALVLGGLCTAIGSGLAQMLTETTGTAFWAATSFLFGIGIGQPLNMVRTCVRTSSITLRVFHQPFLAAQTAFVGLDKGKGSSIVVFAQTLGGVAVAASQSIYDDNKLLHYVQDLEDPALQAVHIIAMGATGFRSALPADLLPLVVNASIKAIKIAFIPVTVFVGVALLLTAALPFNKMRAAQAEAEKPTDTEDRFIAWALSAKENDGVQAAKHEA